MFAFDSYTGIADIPDIDDEFDLLSDEYSLLSPDATGMYGENKHKQQQQNNNEQGKEKEKSKDKEKEQNNNVYDANENIGHGSPIANGNENEHDQEHENENESELELEVKESLDEDDAMSWTIHDVGAWLQDCKELSNVRNDLKVDAINKLKMNDIDGEAFLLTKQEDLEKMGIAKQGVVLKINKAIQKLKAHVSLFGNIN